MRTKLYGKTYRNDELLLNKSCFLPNSFNGNQEARFHFHTTPSTTPKPQLQTEKQPSSTSNLESQLEKPFPDTPKIEFQNETQISDTMKAKSQVEISFSHRKKVISQKISYFRTGRKSERELTNYLLTPKM